MSTVLLVDPSDAEAALLASALRVEGFEVLVRSTASGAREVLAEGPVALVILDLRVRGEAGATGLALARELRAAYPATRLVLTSAYHLSERQLERADCDVSGFIPKPYDLREVVSFVSAKASAPPSSRRVWPAEAVSGIATCEGVASEPTRRVG